MLYFSWYSTLDFVFATYHTHEQRMKGETVGYENLETLYLTKPKLSYCTFWREDVRNRKPAECFCFTVNGEENHHHDHLSTVRLTYGLRLL